MDVCLPLQLLIHMFNVMFLQSIMVSVYSCLLSVIWNAWIYACTWLTGNRSLGVNSVCPMSYFSFIQPLDTLIPLSLEWLIIKLRDKSLGDHPKLISFGINPIQDGNHSQMVKKTSDFTDNTKVFEKVAEHWSPTCTMSINVNLVWLLAKHCIKHWIDFN